MAHVSYPAYLPLGPSNLICASSAGVPQVHHFGQEGLHNVLVIDLLGPNLEDLFDMCGRRFSIKTVCMAAKQMVLYFLPGWLLCHFALGPILMDANHYLRSPGSSQFTTSRSSTVILNRTIF